MSMDLYPSLILSLSVTVAGPVLPIAAPSIRWTGASRFRFPAPLRERGKRKRETVRIATGAPFSFLASHLFTMSAIAMPPDPRGGRSRPRTDPSGQPRQPGAAGRRPTCPSHPCPTVPTPMNSPIASSPQSSSLFFFKPVSLFFDAGRLARRPADPTPSIILTIALSIIEITLSAGDQRAHLGHRRSGNLDGA